MLPSSDVCAEIGPDQAAEFPLAGRRPHRVRRRASALLGADMRRGFASVIDQALVSGTSFGTSVIIGRTSTREELGVYALGLSVVLFIRGVQGELVCSPYMVFGNRRDGRDLAAYTGSTLVHYLLLTALSTAALSILAILGPFSPGLAPAPLGATVWVLIGALPFMLLREYIRQVSFCHLQLRVVLAVDSCIAIIQLGALLLLARWDALSAGAAYAVMGAACALACLAWFAARVQPLQVVPAQIRADWLHNWNFSKWTLAGLLIGSTTPFLMPWVIALAHGEAATGMFAACNTLINCAAMYVTGMTNVLTPRAARAYARGGVPALSQVLKQTAMLFAVTLGAFCLLILLCGDLPTRMVYGPRYSGTGPVLALLAIALFCNSLGITAGNGLWAVGRPAANFGADVCTLAVTVTVLLVAVSSLGVLGAALALLAGAVSGAAVRGTTLLHLLASLRARPDLKKT
jgi:O-antigen/teichoic acid export membrane protein